MKNHSNLKKNNVHFLENISTRVESSSSEISNAELLSRMDQLEDEMEKKISRLEDQIKVAPSKLLSPEKFANELNSLKSSFDQQLLELLGRLKKPREAQARHTYSFLQRLDSSLGNFIRKLNPFAPSPELLHEEVDPFGRDPEFEQKLKPFFDFLYYRYWRVSTYGLEHIPSTGRSLLVSNHSGTLPYDGSMIRMAITNDHPSGRDVRFLVEDFVYYLPFLGTTMYRIGGVRASPENAKRLLENNHLVTVFPEGVKGIGKYYSERYHLQRFGRGGFIKLALQTESPIIPVAVIGAEEIHPILFKSSLLAKPLGIPYVPFTPTLPWLGLLGLIPLPSKWSIHFGAPIDLSRYGKKTLDDELQIHKLSEMVRQTIQRMVTEALRQRRSVWFG